MRKIDTAYIIYIASSIAMNGHYKQRFSEDVIPLIDHGYKYVGVQCDESACCSCYTFGECEDTHRVFKWISYNEFVNENQHIIFQYIRLPLPAFKHMFKNGNYNTAFWMLYHCRNLDHNLNAIILKTASI